jgi:predicted RNase H-like HicB family nuclease
MRYLAFIHSEQDEGETTSIGISFPDFPGCVSCGDTIEDAITMGGEALAFHIEGMIEDGEPLPEPRLAADIIADPDLDDWRGGAEFAWVPVIMDAGSPRRVNISLDHGLLNAIDDEAKRRGMTRSALLASAAQKEITAA